MADLSSSNTSAKLSTGQATSMSELMARSTKKIVTYKKGDLVKGTITKLAKNEILLDLGGKTEAVVLEKERSIMNSLLSILKVGDTVEASILNPESDLGQTVVSLRRFIDQKIWTRLEKLKEDKEAMEVTVLESTKGGFVVRTKDGLTAFLPNSHISFAAGAPTVGQTITVYLYELNKADDKIVVSQRTAVSEEDFEQIKKTLKPEEKLSATVINATSFGVFVSLPVKVKSEEIRIDGLVHISEIAWERSEEVGSLFTPGQSIEVVVLGFDNDAKRVDLSIKRLSEDPFAIIAKRFPVESKATGTVSRLSGGNVFLDLGDGAEGIIRKEKVPPTVTYTEGQSVNVTVTDIDTKRHRIYVSPVLLEKPLMYR